MAPTPDGQSAAEDPAAGARHGAAAGVVGRVLGAEDAAPLQFSVGLAADARICSWTTWS